MNIKRNFDVNLFDDCIDSNLKNLKEYRSYGTAEYHYVQRGFYLDQILRFLETFPNRWQCVNEAPWACDRIVTNIATVFFKW